jgi:membrane protein
MKAVINLIKKTFSEWSEDNVARLAAALAYYTVFSLPPLLVIIISLAGLFGQGQAAQSQVMTQVQGVLGEEGRAFVEGMIQNASKPATGIVASVIGVITLVIGALGVFAELKNALNTIWEVKLKPTKGTFDSIKRLVFGRLISFAMLIVIGFLLLVSLVISASLAYFGQYLGDLLPISDLALQILNFVISFGLITVLFALIFKFLPDAEIAWRDVWLGAAMTSLLFTIGKFALGLYLGRSNVGTTFGAAGSLAILLIWIYYSAQIVFLGAEFTQVYANVYGSRVKPDEDAVKVTEEERAEQGIPHQEKLGAASLVISQGKENAANRDLRQPARYTSAFTYASSSPRRKGFLDRVFYSAIMFTQFIPSLRSINASKNE